MLDYIKNERARGTADTDIESALVAKNHSLDDIAEGIATAQNAPAPVPIPPIPMPTRQGAVLQKMQVPPSLASHAAYATPKKKTGSRIVAAPLLIALLFVIGIGGVWYFETSQLTLQSAGAPTSSSQPVPSAAGLSPQEATTTDMIASSTPVEPFATYTFTPRISNIPSFSFEYPASFEAPQTQENSRGVQISFSSSTPAELIMVFSLFSSPLQTGQTPEQYLQSIFPTGASTDVGANGRAIFRVVSPALPQNQSVYYIFLKNTTAMTIEMTTNDATTSASEDFGVSTQDALAQSLQFADPAY